MAPLQIPLHTMLVFVGVAVSVGGVVISTVAVLTQFPLLETVQV